MQPNTTASTQAHAPGFSLPGWLVGILSFLIAALLPLLLILLNARLLMNPFLMQWEYNRPNFPRDPYGFTTEERLEYGPRGMNYLFNNEGIEYLGDLRFEDGSPVFNERELSHMLDVKIVTQSLVRFGIGLILVYAIAVGLLAASQPARPALPRSLLSGGILTVLLIVLGLATVVFAFDWLFTQFHNLFFASGTWMFPTSDTLIRLYPYEFWIDVFAFVFGLTLLEAILIAVVSWIGLRRASAP